MSPRCQHCRNRRKNAPNSNVRVSRYPTNFADRSGNLHIEQYYQMNQMKSHFLVSISHILGISHTWIPVHAQLHTGVWHQPGARVVNGLRNARSCRTSSCPAHCSPTENAESSAVVVAPAPSPGIPPAVGIESLYSPAWLGRMALHTNTAGTWPPVEVATQEIWAWCHAVGCAVSHTPPLQMSHLNGETQNMLLSECDVAMWRERTEQGYQKCDMIGLVTEKTELQI